MVKRLRRSPLTAESGVRFPLGSPRKNNRVFTRLFLVKSEGEPLVHSEGTLVRSVKANQRFAVVEKFYGVHENACHFWGKGANKRMVRLLAIDKRQNEAQFVTPSQLKEDLIISQTNCYQTYPQLLVLTFNSSLYFLVKCEK